MRWDDIDFDIIQKGMITNGPALVSFTEYLNTFSRAYDERWNLILINFGSVNLPQITFSVNQIRSQTGNAQFYDNFRQLIRNYSRLWFRGDYYTSEVDT